MLAAALFALAVEGAAFMLEKLFFTDWPWEAWGLIACAALALGIWLTRNVIPDPVLSEDNLMADRERKRQAWLTFFSNHSGDLMQSGAVILGFVLVGFIVMSLSTCMRENLPNRNISAAEADAGSRHELSD